MFSVGCSLVYWEFAQTYSVLDISPTPNTQHLTPNTEYLCGVRIIADALRPRLFHNVAYRQQEADGGWGERDDIV